MMRQGENMTEYCGKTYIGDLCYVLSNNEWREVCNLIRTEGEGYMQLSNGRELFIFSTKYGDGSYFDQNGFEYYVDSGTLGCTHLLPDQDTKMLTEISYICEHQNLWGRQEDSKIYLMDRIIDTDEDFDEDEW